MTEADVNALVLETLRAGGADPGAERVPPPCVCVMGVTYTAYTPGRLTLTFPVTDAFTNPSGGMQGGFLSAAFDNGFGPLSILTTGGPTVSLDLSTVYLRPVFPENGPVTITVAVVEASRRFVVMEGEAVDAGNRRLARATTRMAVVPCESGGKNRKPVAEKG